MTAERAEVVVWSGGSDSTMLLTERATFESTRGRPVLALTVSGHNQINERQLKSQGAAQRRYFAWAEKLGLHIRHVRVRVHTEGTPDTSADMQLVTWIAHLTPYLPKVCRVAFGYVQGDQFWHHRHHAVAAIEAVAKMIGADWQVDLPYEWSLKGSILNALTQWKVPDDCWWSCEKPKRVGVACGSCKKCVELVRGRAEGRAIKKARKAS